MRKILLFFALTTLFFACRKTEDAPLTDGLNRFEACACSDTSSKGIEADYLSAVIDGIPICFDVPPPGMIDTFPNFLKHGYIKRDTGDQYFDNLYMIRSSHDGKWQLGIFLENTHALERDYPYTLPRPNKYICEIGEFQLLNLEHFNYDLYGPIYDNAMKLTVTSFRNNIFEGSFSGTLNTFKVTNGKFRIRLIVLEEIIDVRTAP